MKTDSHVRALESQWDTAFQKLFEKQKAATLARLEGKRGRQALSESRAPDISKIFDKEFWTKETADLTKPLYLTVATMAGQRVADATDETFDVSTKPIQAFIESRTNKLAGGVSDTTYEAIKAQLAEGVDEGEGIPQLADRITSVFDDASEFRATMIARTEVISSYNGAGVEAAKDMGKDVVQSKEWIATFDERTREGHADADGQVVGIDDFFIVDGEELEYPGDDGGSDENVINCRCTVAFSDEAPPDTGEAEIADNFSREDADARIRDVVEPGVEEALADGLDTQTLHDELGPNFDEYSAARIDEQNSLLDDFFAQFSDVPADNEVIMAGGLPGAGKTTILGMADIDQENYITINPDVMKELLIERDMIPDYGQYGLSPMESASLIHDESSQLAAMAAERAMSEDRNLIFDITMKSAESVTDRLAKLEEAGYQPPQMIFVDVPVDTAIDRATDRYYQGQLDYLDGEGLGGRYVPASFIASQADPEYGSVNRAVFESVKDQASSWQIWSTADSPTLVDSG